MGGDDQIFRSNVSHNYYSEALQAQRKPLNCPTCKRVGRFAGTLNEIYRRIPRTQWESLILCHVCGENVLRREDAVTRQRVWYCESCEICLCTKCQR
ncbi:uncharacterized protein TEOVI_000353200 [Trypanosoma equiperdum]|uniref:Uncharacterized protein n=4 Tax=Trypanozoon TaxID=39700 RepID=Q57WP8_TRYB2|nr:hypothetical protein, conserved [Trypanosoma brucei gambiense DAL972]XP_845776.1 hypothetical protein, conserved [Trypanosoma brucei brucei TREU927]AAX69944.1 hypothetical protein, conserved [Trypanosoma brucei]RHW71444.1 hypothetical protein DPX39_070027100 [Trypanosoma brucei equiperdum]SCU71950.1 hypothetical protein, conserved [Trypanosoma equiperdum]AAZ12217.1 hypothetical protein, conserved [Trypanosoma brucei brucei TREU927]CBH12178.1 hypothetical protein, conserved [Trypanosoma bru|eukprot:XP_011774461.1 hypothetical protein, conserved [Trypanosoma brucei gambiense DAL972]